MVVLTITTKFCLKKIIGYRRFIKIINFQVKYKLFIAPHEIMVEIFTRIN